MERAARLALLALACAACGAEVEGTHVAPVAAPNTAPAEPAWARAAYWDPRLEYEERERLLELLPYESISIEHSGCYGTCPVYRAVLHRPDRVALAGGDYVDRALLRGTDAERGLSLAGEHAGRLTTTAFAYLCLIVETLGFEELEASYSASVMDMETVTIAVTRRDGSSFSVSDHAQQAPPAFRAVQLAVEDALRSTLWREE